MCSGCGCSLLSFRILACCEDSRRLTSLLYRGLPTRWGERPREPLLRPRGTTAREYARPTETRPTGIGMGVTRRLAVGETADRAVFATLVAAPPRWYIRVIRGEDRKSDV